MVEYEDWVSLGVFGDADLPPSEAVMAAVRSWEARRATDSVEWGLVVLSSGEAFERRGKRDRVGFDGLAAPETEWRVLSHTHPLGLPPSAQDVRFLLERPVGIWLRIARPGLPAFELRRRSDVVVTNAFAAILFWEVQNRVRRRWAAGLRDDLRATYFWLEFETECDKLGIECIQDPGTSTS